MTQFYPVLVTARGADLQKILKTLDDLRREQAELPRPTVRPFDFVLDPSLRKILADDYIEAQRSFAVDAFKASAILSGGLIEGMLLDAFHRPEVQAKQDYGAAVARFPKLPKSPTDTNWDRVGLTDLIKAAVVLSILDKRIGGMAEGARDFRDTVHPNAELRMQMRAGREEAQLLWAIVDLTYRQITSYCRTL